MGAVIQHWLIKQRVGERVLPPPNGRNNRGGTHVEPVHPTTNTPPRLFRSEKAGKLALARWLQGRIYVTANYGTEDWRVEKMEDRVAADWVVVPARLSW
jgi:hypothetical protein